MLKNVRIQIFGSKRNTFLFVLLGISILVSIVFAYILMANAGSNIIKITSKWGQMKNPTIAIGGLGDTVLVWQDKGGQTYEIMYQIFNASGMPVGVPGRANRYRPNDQSNPSVAMDESGNFIIVWQSYKQDGSGAGIYARNFSYDGKSVTKEFRANTYVIGSQSYPNVAMSDSGDFVITWVSEQQNGYVKDIHAQIFNSMGEKIGKEIKVGTGVHEIEDTPSVSMDKYGNFIIVWQGRDKNDWNIYGQIFDINGNRVSESDILINTTTDCNQKQPDVSIMGSSQFIVVWNNQSMHDVLEVTMENINGQIFKKTGSKSGGEFEITSPTFGHQEHPSVTQTAFSEAYVSWGNYNKNGTNSNEWAIYGQAVRSNGTNSGEMVKISADEDRWNKSPVVASNGDGVLGVIWTSLNHVKYKKAVHYKKLVEPNS